MFSCWLCDRVTQWTPLKVVPAVTAVSRLLLVVSQWRHDDIHVGRRQPCHHQRGWYPSWDLQGDTQEDPCHTSVTSHRGSSQLRPNTQRVFLRQTSGRLRTNTQLLPDRKIALPDRRVWSAVRAGTRLLGTRRKSGDCTSLIFSNLQSYGPTRKPSMLIRRLSGTDFTIKGSRPIRPQSFLQPQYMCY